MYGNENTDRLNSFIYQGSITNKEGGCNEDVQTRIAKS